MVKDFGGPNEVRFASLYRERFRYEANYSNAATAIGGRTRRWKAMKRGVSEMVSLLLESTKFNLCSYERFAVIEKVRAQRGVIVCKG